MKFANNNQSWITIQLESSKNNKAMKLRSIFDANSSHLAEELENMSLPTDSRKIQTIIAEYFGTLFDESGDYRENLTQSEDYILQSAIALLNAQQKMAYELSSTSTSSPNTTNTGSRIDPISADAKTAKHKIEVDKYPHVVAGTAIGGVGGALVLGTWGALFGAIAGTAIVLYLVSSNDGNKTKAVSIKPTLEKENTSQILNIKILLSIIGNICDSIDELISTFRSQIKKVVHKYENQEQPSIEKNYRILLEKIQSLLGYKRTHTEQEEKYVKKLQQRIEDVGEALENYNLLVVDYDGTNEELFDVVTGQDVKATKMVYPAIVKDNIAVLKGKIFKN